MLSLLAGSPSHRAALLALGVAALAPATARAGEPLYQLETQVASTYVDRGIPQYASRRDPCLQTSVLLNLAQLGGGTLSVATASTVALSEYGGQPGTQLQLDLSASYAFQLERVAVTAGYLAELLPHHAPGTPFDDSHQLFVTAAYDHPVAVPSIAVYGEVAHQQGAYVTVGASRDWRAGALTVTPSLSVGGAAYRRYLGEARSMGPHVNDVSAGLAAKLELDGGLYAVARLAYALRATPGMAMEEAAGWGFSGRSTAVGSLAVGIAR